MSERNDDRPPNGVAEGLSDSGLAEPVLVRERGGWRRVWRLTRLGLVSLLVLALVAAAILWIERKPIANNVLASELAKRGVQATYTLDRVGLRTQQVSNLVIGDPKDPDLTAERAVVQLRVLLTGKVEVYRIVARGVRLHGQLAGGKVSWGQIDKLLPPPSGKPFSLPNIVVDVADTTIRLDTPFGRIGVALIGSGNLSGGFKGRIAAAAPSLRPGRCSVDGLKANLAIAVNARRPHVVGPVQARGFACPQSRLAMTSPRMEIDSRFSEAFGSFDGKGRLSFASLVAGTNGLANATSNLTFKGTPNDIAGRIDLAAQRARLAQIFADRTRLDGSYKLGARRGTLDFAARYAATGVTIDPAMTNGLTGPLLKAAGSPVGEIATSIARAVQNASRNFNVSGRLAAVNRPGSGGVRIITADADAPSGAKIAVAGGDGVTYYWPSGRIRIDGNIETSGGGLPEARIALDSPRVGRGISGTATIAPYTAGRSRLALAPLYFAAGSDGTTRFQTVAVLDGPIASGRVTGLRLPIEGSLGANGGLTIGRGCIDARFTSLQVGALRLGASRIPICPTRGPAIVSQAPGGSIRLGAQTSNLRLAGSLGRSPFLLTSRRLAMLGERSFESTGLAVRLGRPESPVLLNAERLLGDFRGKGVGGKFAGLGGTIGNVPLLLSDSSGSWLFDNDRLDLDGSVTVSDRNPNPRFYPLRSENMKLSLADEVIRADGRLFNPETRVGVTDVSIEHRLASGEGGATLDVPGIRFGPGLQPEQLTRLTEGVIALVNGNLNGRGRINWHGNGTVDSTGSFNLVDMNLAAPFGPVTGLNSTINFTDLLALETAPNQQMTVASINPGILVKNGVIRYQLLRDQLVKIERGEWPFMGGKLILQETVLNFARPTPKRLTFEVVGLNAKTFVDTMGFSEIGATGVFDGVLPMVFDESGGRIVGGRLDSRPPGGTLSYNGVVNRANLGLFGGLAFDALRSLRFRSMIIRLDGYLDGEFATRLTIDQVGLGEATKTQRFLKTINKVPFKFNVTIRGPFRALIATAKSFRDPRTVISDALPVPLEDIPGIVTEVRKHEESDTQTQTPVKDEVEVNPPATPAK
ncbi:MAG TPA: YdbH domain-containing protein [Sphingomicrobium sp.]|nr:YdbH domain-containing protein [Sphingomicrobium sp.]